MCWLPQQEKLHSPAACKKPVSWRRDAFPRRQETAGSQMGDTHMTLLAGAITTGIVDSEPLGETVTVRPPPSWLLEVLEVVEVEL